MAASVSASATAPGKIILFGEHAVVYGIPAIACCLSDLRTRVSVLITQGDELEEGEEPQLTVELADIVVGGARLSIPISILQTFERQYPSSWGVSTEGNPVPIAAVDEVLKSNIEKLVNEKVPESSNNQTKEAFICLMYLAAKILCALDQPTTLTKESISIVAHSQGLPIGAGLGSSAAFNVAAASALLCTRFKHSQCFPNTSSENSSMPDFCAPSSLSFLTTVNNWAFIGEKILHGTPSGLDNTISTFGGTLSFQKTSTGPSFKRLKECPLLRVLLTNTKVPRVTRELVASVAKLKAENPEMVDSINAAIKELTNKFEKLISETSADTVAFTRQSLDALEGKIALLFEQNHALLRKLGVSHPALETVCDLSKAVGLSSKLTGAGGGGCAVTLTGVGAGLDKSENQSDDPKLERLESLKATLIEQGFDCFQSDVGGEGVKVKF